MDLLKAIGIMAVCLVILGATYLGVPYFKANLFNKPPVADIDADIPSIECDYLNYLRTNEDCYRITTPTDIWFTDKPAVVLNASKSYDLDGKIEEYQWLIYWGADIITTASPVLEIKLNAAEEHYKITLNVKDDKGKVSVAKFYRISILGRQTPDKPFIIYDDIKIIGEENFRKDVVMVLEFVKKYSPSDYLFIKENTRKIYELNQNIFSTRGLGGHNQTYLAHPHDVIWKYKNLVGVISILSHEAGHSYEENIGKNYSEEVEKICGFKLNIPEDFDICTKKLGYSDIHQWHPSELFAESFAIKARVNLSYVNQSEMDKFYAEFNFSNVNPSVASSRY